MGGVRVCGWSEGVWVGGVGVGVAVGVLEWVWL